MSMGIWLAAVSPTIIEERAKYFSPLTFSYLSIYRTPDGSALTRALQQC